MKFSYNWLSELVDGLTTDPVELGRLITIKTAECEGVERFGGFLEKVDLARVASAEPIEGSHNRKAVVETKRYGTKTVVCGAPNCRAGLLTAYVPAGTKLGEKEIRKAVIAGVESDGMLASAAELGLNRDHEGVVELDEKAALAHLADWIIEIDNKSLTHRPDLWGHLGMAREVAAIVGKRVKDPVRADLLPKGDAPIAVAIEDHKLCPRYSALVFENVTVEPSPLWFQARLEAVGLNPINNVVDVTNYILAELPQPMHAFDADKLHGGITVRSGRAGESMLALNGETYEVGPSNLLITDEQGPIAIAGVIGGQHSSINESTKRIVLESANFQASSIRKTSAALKLRTDASMRFEKSQDPANTTRGLARAIELLQLVCPGIKVVGGLADNYKPLPAPAPIDLPLDWLEWKLGRAIEKAEVRRILESLFFGVEEPAANLLRVTVPSWRATKDISIKDDMVEEVGRVIGYASITPTPPLAAAAPPPANPEREFHHQVREIATQQGFTEVYNYSFVSEAAARAFDFAPEDHLQVRNPIAADQELLRKSLLPNIWRNITDNARHLDEFRFFEIGKEIHKQPQGQPQEEVHLVAAMYSKGNGEASLFELKRLAECLLPQVRVDLDTPARSFEHPHRKATVCLGDRVIGRLFELHPKLVETGRAAILDVQLAALAELRPKTAQYTPLRRYPTSHFDLSVVAGRRTPAGTLHDRLVELAGTDLVAIEFLRTYAIPDSETNSVSWRLEVGAPDRTLSSDEVTSIRDRVIAGMRSAGFDLRL
jgi:phenylalanyl-tRNA synthetase beta chain